VKVRQRRAVEPLSLLPAPLIERRAVGFQVPRPPGKIERRMAFGWTDTYRAVECGDRLAHAIVRGSRVPTPICGKSAPYTVRVDQPFRSTDCRACNRKLEARRDGKAPRPAVADHPHSPPGIFGPARGPAKSNGQTACRRCREKRKPVESCDICADSFCQNCFTRHPCWLATIREASRVAFGKHRGEAVL
jgi:hypothetical protein